ncbi:hypothetical protein KH5H1_58370 [Corallococcus caeni]|nr:hypothetical protein KH5H1_58370 [Corallococcus sp. KH5-1]
MLKLRSPLNAPSRSWRLKSRSNFAVVMAPPRSARRRPGRSSAATGAFWNVNATWNSGERLRSRAPCMPSTSFSKGRSWWAYAASVVAFTWASSVRNESPGSMRARSTSVLTKKPMSPSVSARLRLAMAEPTSTSSCPE